MFELWFWSYTKITFLCLDEEIKMMQEQWERSLAGFSVLLEQKEKEIRFLGEEIKRSEKILEAEERKKMT